jgi:predicted nucleic acid-binding protein
MRIVLDTNILARANPRSKSLARGLLLAILESAKHVLVLSPFLLRETERVLSIEVLTDVELLIRLREAARPSQ